MKKLITIIVLIFTYQLSNAQDTIVKYNGELIRAKITEITSAEVKYKKFDFIDGPTYVERKSNIELIKYSSGLKEHFDNSQQTNTNKGTPQNSPDYYGSSDPKNNYTQGNKITEFGSRYQYQNGLIGENEMQRILMNTKDKHIMGLIQQSKQARGMQYIGFGGIVLGMSAYLCLIQSTTSTTAYNSQTGYPTTTPNPNKNSLQIAAGMLALVAIACPIVSGVYKAERHNYNRDAIKLYNQKY